jgi:hypothetical protein
MSAGAIAAEEKGNRAGASNQANANAAKKRKPANQTVSNSAKAKAAANQDDHESSAKRSAVKRARANGAGGSAGHTANGDADARDRDGGPHSSSSRSRAGRNRVANLRDGDEDDDGDDDMSDAGSAAPRSARVARAPRSVDESISNAPTVGDDADERRYCFCNNVSYGDMIGCDDDDCEREWVSMWRQPINLSSIWLTSTGLSTVPSWLRRSAQASSGNLVLRRLRTKKGLTQQKSKVVQSGKDQRCAWRRRSGNKGSQRQQQALKASFLYWYG